MHGQLNVRSNIVRSYQILTLDAVAFIIVSGTINKSLYETNSTVCSCDRTHFVAFFWRLECNLVAYLSLLVQLSRNIIQRYKCVETRNLLKRHCLNIGKTAGSCENPSAFL